MTHYVIWLVGYLVNCDACLSNYMLLLVFTARWPGRLFTADFRQRRKSTVGTLRKTVRPVTHAVSKLLISVRDGNLPWVRFGKLFGP